MKLKVGMIVLSVLLLSSSLSVAKEHATDDDWQFSLAPFYLWAINIDGNLTMGSDRTLGNIRPTVPVSVEFDDIFDTLEAAFIVQFEAMHKSNFGLLIDVDYLNISNDLSNAFGLGLNVDMEVTLAEVAGLYRVNRDAHTFYAHLGLRGYRMNPEVSLIRGPEVADQTQDWLDPFIGGRWIWNFAENWSVVARGDIGGFGIGSDFAWQALGLVEWQPFEYVSFLAGYRALDIDYEDGNGSDYFRFDATIHGPILGLKFKW